MTKKQFSYDSRCEDLARLFLGDATDDAGLEAHAAPLAQHIQEAIESYLLDVPPSSKPSPLRESLWCGRCEHHRSWHNDDGSKCIDNGGDGRCECAGFEAMSEAGAARAGK